MFDYWYLGSVLNAIDKIPREVTLCVAAYALITELHKRHSNVRIKEIEANAKVRTAELQVEALAIKRDMQMSNPDSKPA